MMPSSAAVFVKLPELLGANNPLPGADPQIQTLLLLKEIASGGNVQALDAFNA
jgi:hypothetical protein